MTEAPETIKAWNWNGKTNSGQWHVNGQGETTEYVRADLHTAAQERIEALEAENELLWDALCWLDTFSPEDTAAIEARLGLDLLTRAALATQEDREDG